VVVMTVVVGGGKTLSKKRVIFLATANYAEGRFRSASSLPIECANQNK
jgi:hypothetical protein